MAASTSTQLIEPLLAQFEKQLGFVPNLFKEMKVSPATLLVYIKGMEALSQGELTPRQQQAVALTVSTANGCHYCQAAHGWLGGKVGISVKDLEAIRQGLVPETEEVGKVVRASRVVLEKKGWLESADLKELEQQGLNRAQLYEIVALIGLKTISNYVNHMAHTPVDAQFGT